MVSPIFHFLAQTKKLKFFRAFKRLFKISRTCVSIWIRFFIVSFFEYTIGILVGIQIPDFLSIEPSLADKYTVFFTYLSAPIIVLVPIATAISVCVMYQKVQTLKEQRMALK